MRRIIVLIALSLSLASWANAQDAGNPFPEDRRPRTPADPASIVEVYFYLAAREATPYETVALLDTFEEQTTRTDERLPISALREFERGGGIVVSRESWIACNRSLKDGDTCPVFTDMILLSTSRPYVVADTLRLPFTRILVRGNEGCSPAGVSGESGYHFFVAVDARLIHTGSETNIASDSFTPEGLERFRHCRDPDD